MLHLSALVSSILTNSVDYEAKHWNFLVFSYICHLFHQNRDARDLMAPLWLLTSLLSSSFSLPLKVSDEMPGPHCTYTQLNKREMGGNAVRCSRLDAPVSAHVTSCGIKERYQSSQHFLHPSFCVLPIKSEHVTLLKATAESFLLN